MRVGVSLLTCNLRERKAHLKATEFALRSLLESDLSEFDWALDIQDNGSTCPDTKRLIERVAVENPRVQATFSARNLGIARGRNACYQRLHEYHAPDFLVEVHTDHVFPRVWLRPLIERLQRPDHQPIGILGAGLVTGGGEWRSPRFRLTYDRTYAEFAAELERQASAWRRPNRVLPGLTHPCVIRWAMVEGLAEIDEEGRPCVYDPDLPGLQNFEDTDLAYRATKADWMVMVDFASIAYHHYHYVRCHLRTDENGEPHFDGHAADNNAGYNANARHCLERHGPEFMQFATNTLGRWLMTAFGR